MNTLDPIESALHRALQQRRAWQVGDQPPLQAMLHRAKATVATERADSTARLSVAGKWLLRVAAAVALMAALFQDHRGTEPPPSLAQLVGAIADEHERYASAAFGQWAAPSEQFPPAFNLEL